MLSSLHIGDFLLVVQNLFHYPIFHILVSFEKVNRISHYKDVYLAEFN